MLAIQVEFVNYRYIATAYNNRMKSEWPPHPARLFSALVATHFDDFHPSIEEHAILEWLERQGSPLIVASSAIHSDVVTSFVPVNDTTIFRNIGYDKLESALFRVQNAELALQQSNNKDNKKILKKANSDLNKIKNKHRKLVSDCDHTDFKKTELKAGLELLPRFRKRQPRTFNSVVPNDPCVTFIWPDALPNSDQYVILNKLAERVVHLGHSLSLVVGRLIDNPPKPNWLPTIDQGTVQLRIPYPGLLKNLEERYAIHQGIEPRISPCEFQSYTNCSIEVKNIHTIFGEDWIILKYIRGPILTTIDTAKLSRQIRRILMTYADDPVPEIISGHKSDGTPSKNPHLVIVPLPFVGSQYADGRILGVAIIFPLAASFEERSCVFRALGRWESNNDNSILPVLLDKKMFYFTQLEHQSKQYMLRPSTWCQPSYQWRTVTPIALDRSPRNPKNLYSRDPIKCLKALNEAKDSICSSFKDIGIQPPKQIEICGTSIIGSIESNKFPRYPENKDYYKRTLVHAILNFDYEPSGLMSIGAGRFNGIGQCIPWSLK